MSRLLKSPVAHNTVLALGLLTVLAVIPMTGVSRYFLGQLILFFFYVTVAGQWNLLYGIAGIFSLAQLALFGIGAYATAMLNLYLDITIWLAIPAGAVITMLVSLVLGLSCLRLSGVYVALLTLAAAQTLYVLIITDTECFMRTETSCRQLTGGAAGFYGYDDFGMRAALGRNWLVGNYYIVLGVAAISFAVTCTVMKSTLGLAFMALRDNCDYAQMLGVNRFRAQLAVFALSAFFTGLMGGIYAIHFRTVSPSIMLLSQLLFLIAGVVLGGVGRPWGAFVGIGTLMLLDEKLRDFGDYRMIGIGMILLIIPVAFSEGMLGIKLRKLFGMASNSTEKKHET